MTRAIVCMQLREMLQVALALAGILIAINILIGCGADATTRVVNGVDTADYGAALLRCKDEGKDAGSKLVYFRCANEVDRRFDAGTFDGGI